MVRGYEMNEEINKQHIVKGLYIFILLKYFMFSIQIFVHI